jgi:hypothetical protein
MEGLLRGVFRLVTILGRFDDEPDAGETLLLTSLKPEALFLDDEEEDGLRRQENEMMRARIARRAIMTRRTKVSTCRFESVI